MQVVPGEAIRLPKPQVHGYRMKATEGKTQVYEEGENGDSTHPAQQDKRPHKEYSRNTNPPNKQTSMASPRCHKSRVHYLLYCDRGA